MSLIGLIVGLLILCLLWWACNAILHAFGVGDPIATVVKVVFVVLAVLVILSAFGYGPGLRLT